MMVVFLDVVGGSVGRVFMFRVWVVLVRVFWILEFKGLYGFGKRVVLGWVGIFLGCEGNCFIRSCGVRIVFCSSFVVLFWLGSWVIFEFVFFVKVFRFIFLVFGFS